MKSRDDPARVIGLAIAACAAALLAGCGGGGDDGSSDSDDVRVTPGDLGRLEVLLTQEPAIQYMRYDITATVLDKTGAGVSGVDVNLVSGEVTSPQSRLSNASGPGGTVAYAVSINATGNRTITLTSTGYGSVTFTVNVRNPVERFDGWYLCFFDYPMLSSTNMPAQYYVVPEVERSKAFSFVGSEDFSIDADGNMSGDLRYSLDFRDRMRGTFTVDPQGNGTGQGTLERYEFGSPRGTGTWTCARGVNRY